jgi:hypothetical protein
MLPVAILVPVVHKFLREIIIKSGTSQDIVFQKRSYREVRKEKTQSAQRNTRPATGTQVLRVLSVLP